MTTILLLLSFLWVGGYTINHTAHNIKYNPNMRGNKTQMVIGSIIGAIISGVAWWYIIDHIIK